MQARDLTSETFKLYMNALINLPFVMTDDYFNENMITIRRKDGDNDLPDFQIWRNPTKECLFECTLGIIEDVKTFHLDDIEHLKSGDHTIELYHGVDQIIL